jgi:hypothetical protein
VILIVPTAKGRHFDNLSARAHVDNLKPAADDTRVAETPFYLFGIGGRRYVEIFWVLPQQQVTHCAADYKSFKPLGLEPVHDLQGAAREIAITEKGACSLRGHDPNTRSLRQNRANKSHGSRATKKIDKDEIADSGAS